MLNITTNNVPRPLIESWEVSPKEREDFDYIDWAACDEGRDSASFVRYKGRLYDLAEFMRVAIGGPFAGWDGYASDSYFSGVLVRFVNDGEYCILGRYCS